jgi:hypothetical protein
MMRSAELPIITKVGTDMEINIENEETCALVEELAQLIGVDAEEAVSIAVRERLERSKSQQRDGIAGKAR